MADTHLIRGPHGAIARVTVPSPGMDRRTFDARVASGAYTILDDAPPAVEDDLASPDEDPDSTVDDDGGYGPPAGNASTDAWRHYAVSLGFDVPEDAGREDIKQLVGDDD